tara:strand:+ start:3087 stop:3296 length:210 start_codon:yes stop_codon:yes gene_type:complete
MGRVSQFIDFINQDEMPIEENREVLYPHITLEDEKDKDGKVIRKNPIKKIRREYRLWLRQVEKNQQLNR